MTVCCQTADKLPSQLANSLPSNSQQKPVEQPTVSCHDIWGTVLAYCWCKVLIYCINLTGTNINEQLAPLADAAAMSIAPSPDSASSPEAPITSPPPDQLFPAAFPGMVTAPLTGLFALPTETTVSGVANIIPTASVAGIQQPPQPHKHQLQPQQPYHTEQSSTLTPKRLKTELLQDPANKNGSLIQ